MPKPGSWPQYVRCVTYQASVEPLEENEADEPPFFLNFEYRVDKKAGLFRISSRMYDDGLLVLMTHIVRFDEAPLPPNAPHDVTTRFIDNSVIPAVFPYIQEGASSAAARVRPEKPLNVGWDYGSPLDLKRYDDEP